MAVSINYLFKRIVLATLILFMGISAAYGDDLFKLNYLNMDEPVIGIGVTSSSGTSSVTSSNELDTKEGRSTAYSISNLVSFGNAARFDIFNIRALGLTLFTRQTTVVIGK